jgi:hypothetical protein
MHQPPPELDVRIEAQPFREQEASSVQQSDGSVWLARRVAGAAQFGSTLTLALGDCGRLVL